jgi:mRNA interferase MazF
MVDLNPIKGHEEGNYRPVLVINRDDIVVPGDVKIVLPITTHGGTFKTKTPLDIPLNQETKTKGFIQTFQPRTIDLAARKYKYVEDIPEDLLNYTLNILTQLFLKKN